MFRRAFTPVALACTLAMPFSSAAAQSFRYATGTHQYRMTVQAKITQSMMGQSQDVNMSSGQKFTMTLTSPASDTLAMAATIDSIYQTMEQLGPVPGIDQLIGQKVSAKLSPAGKYYASTTAKNDSVPTLAGVAAQLEHILPYIPVDLKKGATWTDTSTETTSQDGLDVKRQVISTYTVTGDTAVGSATTWNVLRQSTSSSTGSGTIQGQRATMDGTSKGTGHVLITHDGVFVGGVGQEDVVAKLALPDAGVSYDITTTANTNVETIH